MYSVFVLLFLILTGCESVTNDELYNKMEQDFSADITENKAEYFEYLYDGLVPQSSYFVESKIQYLKFKHNPEVGFSEGLIYFDFETDAIKKYVLRKVRPDWREYEEGKNEKFFDTIFVLYPNRKDGEVYYGNKLIDKKYREDILKENLDFIYAMKKRTEYVFKNNTQ